MEEQQDASDVPNHMEDSIESSAKPKVKTKAELEHDILQPTSEVESNEDKAVVLDTVALNHVSEEMDAVVTGSVIAGLQSPRLKDDVHSETVVAPVSSVTTEAAAEVAPNSPDTQSAIVNHVSDVVVVPDDSRTEPEVVCLTELDVSVTPVGEDVTESVPSPAVAVASPPQLLATISSNSPAVPEAHADSNLSALSPPSVPSVELIVASPTVQPQQQPETQQQPTSPVANDVTVATLPPDEDKAATDQSVSSIVKPKCEVEDALNDVKRDDFFAGKFIFI